MKRRTLYFVTAIIGLVAINLAARETWGRDRADLLCWVSFDGGPLTFAKTFYSGQVGPFDIGESRSEVEAKAKLLDLYEQDRKELAIGNSEWRMALPAISGGHIIYTLTFKNNRLETVRAHYSALAGL